MLQVSTRTLQSMIQQGRLPAFKVDNQGRIRKRQLKWFEKNESLVVQSNGSVESDA